MIEFFLIEILPKMFKPNSVIQYCLLALEAKYTIKKYSTNLDGSLYTVNKFITHSH